MADAGDRDVRHLDKVWFAVDVDGNVGAFWSGESGAVPKAAALGEKDLARAEQLPASDRGSLLEDLDGRVAPGPASVLARHLQANEAASRAILFFLKASCVADDHIAAGRARHVPSTSAEAVGFESCPAEFWKRVHDENLCLGCFRWIDMVPAAGRAGLFVYRHEFTEGLCAGPYSRVSVPSKPMGLGELPESVRGLLSGVRFGYRFAEAPHVQPAEHADCESLSGAWLANDGRTVRPLPGMDEEYADDYPRLSSVPEYVCEPPKVAPPTRRPAIPIEPPPNWPMDAPASSPGLSGALFFAFLFAAILVRAIWMLVQR